MHDRRKEERKDLQVDCSLHEIEARLRGQLLALTAGGRARAGTKSDSDAALVLDFVCWADGDKNICRHLRYETTSTLLVENVE